MAKYELSDEDVKDIKQLMHWAKIQGTIQEVQGTVARCSELTKKLSEPIVEGEKPKKNAGKTAK